MIIEYFTAGLQLVVACALGANLAMAFKNYRRAGDVLAMMNMLEAQGQTISHLIQWNARLDNRLRALERVYSGHPMSELEIARLKGSAGDEGEANVQQ